MAHSLTRRRQLCFTLMICTNKIVLSLELWKRRLENKFHDLINNGPGKVKTWFHKVHYAPVSSSVFFSEATPPPPQGLLSKVTVLKFHKTPWKTPVVDFCFSCRASTSISTENELRSMFSLEFWRRFFSECLRLLAVPKSSHRRRFIKKAVIKSFVIFTSQNF